MSTSAAPATVSASHVARVIAAAGHPKAVAERPKGFGVLYEKTTTPGFQVFTLEDGSVAIACRKVGDDEPTPPMAQMMVLQLATLKPTLKAAGFQGIVATMERTNYPYLKLTGRTATAVAPKPAEAPAAPAAATAPA